MGSRDAVLAGSEELLERAAADALARVGGERATEDVDRRGDLAQALEAHDTGAPEDGALLAFGCERGLAFEGTREIGPSGGVLEQRDVARVHVARGAEALDVPTPGRERLRRIARLFERHRGAREELAPLVHRCVLRALLEHEREVGRAHRFAVELLEGGERAGARRIDGAAGASLVA
jgi:hypothetical protein